MAEMIMGDPLFPGDSSLDQIGKIIKVLGTPTEDDILDFASDAACRWMLKQPQYTKMAKILTGNTNDTYLFVRF